MKYKKIAGFIKKRKYLEIHTKNNEQWISDGVAAYPVIGMPIMNEQEMLHFLDFQADDNIEVVEWKSDEIITDDTAPHESLIEDFGPSVIIGGDICSTFYTRIGALVVADKYINPCFSHSGEGELTFWLRFVKEETPCIAVKKGFTLLAVILPIKTWGIGDDTLECYEKLCAMINLTNENMKEKEAE